MPIFSIKCKENAEKNQKNQKKWFFLLTMAFSFDILHMHTEIMCE